MKKIFVIFAFLISITVGIISAQAAFGIKMYLDGEEIECEVSPIIINERTMVPVRVLFEKLDAEVYWDAQNYLVHISSEQADIRFKIGSNVAHLNGSEVTLDAVPVILHDRTLVPIRFVSESLGYKVNWDDLTKAVLITSPDAPLNKADISGVKVEQDNTVKISLTGEVKPRISTVDNPFRLILDFDNTSLSISDGKNTLKNDCLTEVRWAVHEVYSRVVLEFNGNQKYTISGEGTKLVTITPDSSEREDYSAQITVPNEGTTPPDEDISAEDEKSDGDNDEEITNSDDDLQIEEDTKLSFAIEELEYLPEYDKMLIVIDAGHGGKDVGALAKDENGETLLDSEGNFLLQEKHVNLVIAQKIRDRLQEKGIHVLMTRDDDTFTGTNKENLMARCDLANENNATLFVSVHNNSAESPKATGTEICYTEESSGTYGITSKVLANNILPYLVEATGLQNRGIINRPNLVVLKNTAMPAVLLECGFVTCETDRNVLLSEKKLNDIAEGVAYGIIKSMKQIAGRG